MAEGNIIGAVILEAIAVNERAIPKIPVIKFFILISLKKRGNLSPLFYQTDIT